MANLKEIRTSIISVTNTRQVTSAMKMVSAAKLRKSQDAILKIKPYSDKMQHIIETVSGSITANLSSPLFRLGHSGNTLVILITSNKGLCGVFNTGIARMALDWIKSERAEAKKDNKVKFFTIGKKGHDVISRLGFEIIGREDNLIHKPSFDFTAFFVKELVKKFSNREFNEVVIFYNSFKNAASQQPIMETYLPIKMPESAETKQPDFILEPSPEHILEELAPKMLEIRLHKIILDSIASEHGARMTAMHKATDNATELINTLKLTYNKARQDSITKEILEIVSGANALQGKG
jgi:F-type H+-transporting ATPase subunit gamma